MQQTIKTPIMKMKMIPCIKCKALMPELRLTQYGYKVCVNCSTVGSKRGIPVTRGSGDHTWTETVILNQSTYDQHHPTLGQTLDEDEHIVEFGIE